MSTEQAVKKRGWAKNAAIIFLIVLLVLTFFSNTIMNRALPEVAAQHAMSGSITARIRGSGTVSANDSFEVILNQTRTVSGVNVRLGNEVEAGDVLFTLTGTGSEELDQAQDELSALLLAYEKSLIEAGRGGGFESDERDIRFAREELDEARDALADIPYSAEALAEAQVALGSARAAEDLAEVRVDTAEISEESAQAALTTAEATQTSAQATRNTAYGAVAEARGTVVTREGTVRAAQDALNAQGGADLTTIDRRIADKEAEIASTQNEMDAAWVAHLDNYRQFAENAIAEFGLGPVADPLAWAEENPIYMAAYAQILRAAIDALPALGPPHPEAHLLLAYETIINIESELRALNTDLARLQQDRQNALGGHSADRDQLLRALRDAESALSTARTALRNAEAALTTAESALTTANTALRNAEAVHANARTELTNARRALTDAGRAVDTAEEELATQQGYRTAWQTANTEIRTLQRSLEDLLFALSQKQRDAGVDNALAAIDMREQRNQINRKRDEIRRLEEDETGATVVSPVSGIIRQINISPGQQTQSGMPMAVIEVVDRGFSLSFPVTLDQSRRVSIGDPAEIMWMWGAGEINAVLSSIRNDPQNPATSRILDFDVSGDVESGMSLNLSIGQRSENFEVIVPNNAIRTDTNGDFVLVIMSRSSPLGNRYIATRVDVIILSSDDTHTAVTGGLSSWDFVVTTSNRPVEPGMQIRLVDNP